MLMGYRKVEEVRSINWSSDNEISVSDIFREKIESQHVVRASRDAPIIDFMLGTLVTKLNVEVADVRDEVRPSNDGCHRICGNSPDEESSVLHDESFDDALRGWS
jgi:hypothetical protein